MKVTSVSTTGTRSTITLNESVFAGSVNQMLLAQAIRVYTANGHQSTSRVKTRAEINRTKKKWFKQKGTGNARHAARSAPIFVGGGVAHGPKGVKATNLQLSKSQRQEALKSALRLQVEAIIVNESLEKLGDKTAAAEKSLKKVVAEPGLLLVVLPSRQADLEQGVRNLPYVKTVTAESITAVDVCAADTIMFSPDSLHKLTDRLAKKSTKTTAKTGKTASVEKTAAKAVKTKSTKKAVAKTDSKAKSTVKKTTAAKPAAKKTTKRTTEKK